MSTIRAVAVAALPYSEDGFTIQFAPAGKEFDCPAKLFDGLLDGGLITKPDPKATAEADAAAAAEAKAKAEAEAAAEAEAKAKAEAEAAAAGGDLFSAPKAKR
jgi:hypothetical protein